jgi:hypothetical protein
VVVGPEPVGEALDCSGVPVDSGVKNMGVDEVEFEPEDMAFGLPLGHTHTDQSYQSWEHM